MIFRNHICPQIEAEAPQPQIPEATCKPYLQVASQLSGNPGQLPLVAVLDTGVDWTHPALSASIWRNQREIANGKDDDGNGFKDDILGWSFADGTAQPMDRDGHGTHCAGTIALAGCRVLPVKVLGDSNWGREIWIAAGIRYAARLGVRVISLSLGGYEHVPKIAEAVRWAQAKGCAIVAAAGNDGLDIRKEPIYPACLPGVLSVGALDGSTLWASSNVGAQILAPGKRIRSTLPGNRWGLYSGTSMACPQAAAALALLWSLLPSLTAGQVMVRLLDSTDVLPGVGRRLNLSAAIARTK